MLCPSFTSPNPVDHPLDTMERGGTALLGPSESLYWGTAERKVLTLYQLLTGGVGLGALAAAIDGFVMGDHLLFSVGVVLSLSSGGALFFTEKYRYLKPLQEQIVSLTQQNNQLQSERSSLTRENKALRETQERLASLERAENQQLQQMEKERNNLQSLEEKERKQLEEMQKQNQEISRERDELNRLQQEENKQMLTITQQNDLLKKSVTSLAAVISSGQQQVEHLEQITERQEDVERKFEEIAKILEEHLTKGSNFTNQLGPLLDYIRVAKALQKKQPELFEALSKTLQDDRPL